MTQIDEVEAWKQDVCALLAIPEAERTEQEQIRLWARRVRLLSRGWRVVLIDGVPTCQYIGGDGEPSHWDEILKDKVYHE